MKAVVQMLRKVLVLCSRISVILMMSLKSRAETRNVMATSDKEAEWAERLRSVTVSKATMDRLVMNWLVIEGYQEAAQRFCKESGTDAGIDLDTVSDRMAIRAAIQHGDVRKAIERVQALEASVSPCPPTHTRS